MTSLYNYVRASDPGRPIVNDKSGNWLATFTDGAKTVTLKGAERTFQEHVRWQLH